MTNATLWVGQTGKAELISEMHENHLVNAYAKLVREGEKPEMRPVLATEIQARGLIDMVPAYAAPLVPMDMAMA